MKRLAPVKQLARWMVRFYPARWRARYGAEFDQLIEDTPIQCRDLIGMLRSAWEVRMEATASPRIVNLGSRDIPHGYELESEVEYPLEDGSTRVMRGFHREIDLGDSYITLSHTTRGEAPAQTIVVFGRKGDIDGDFRTDETEMLVFNPDGTIRSTEQTVKTYLKYDALREKMRDRYRSGMAAGLSADQIFQQIRAEH